MRLWMCAETKRRPVNFNTVQQYRRLHRVSGRQTASYGIRQAAQISKYFFYTKISSSSFRLRKNIGFVVEWISINPKWRLLLQLQKGHIFNALLFFPITPINTKPLILLCCPQKKPFSGTYLSFLTHICSRFRNRFIPVKCS